MKKIFMAIVTMLVMSTSVMAQTDGDTAKVLTFDRISNYLELTTSQVEPVRITLAQMGETLKAFENAPHDQKTFETSVKVVNHHKKQMKGLLSDKQYRKYVQMLDKTIANRSDQQLVLSE